jgi:uncharacterized protein YjiS (DUF1127 family)
MQRHIPRFVGLREKKFSLKDLIVPLLRRRNSARSRLHLLDLSDHMLRDIGVNRCEVLYGAAFHSDAVEEPE